MAAPATQESRLHLARRHWRILLLGLAVTASGTISTYIFTYIVTYAQATLHMAAQAGFLAETLGNLTAIPAILLGGWLSDRHGRRPINIWSNFLSLISIYPVFAWIDPSRSEFALVTGMIVLSVPNSLFVGAFYAGLAESLPKVIRGSGFGVVYSVAVAAFGGTTQLVATWLIHVTGSAMAPAWYMIGATAVGQIALMLMPESAPVRSLRSTQLHSPSG